jgi:maleylpyruvate isomerase
LKYLKRELGVEDDARDEWYRHWIKTGFESFESALVKIDRNGPFCLGTDLTLADLCLIPQMYNAHRFEVPLQPYPTLCAIEEACLELDAFQKATPENQDDAN